MNNLKNELAQFTGSENYYKSLNIHYTDGVKFVADTYGAYWLIDLVSSWQFDSRIKPEHFQVFELKVNEDDSAVVEISDGNDNILATQEIPYTDFPIDGIKFWHIEGITLLPSEY